MKYLSQCSQINIMMTSSNENIFCRTGPLCGEFTGLRWIPLTTTSNTEFWCFLWSAPWINRWVNKREAGYLLGHCAHYDVVVRIIRLDQDGHRFADGIFSSILLAEVILIVIQIHWTLFIMVHLTIIPYIYIYIYIQILDYCQLYQHVSMCHKLSIFSAHERMQTQMCKYIETWTIWSTFCRRHFQTNLLEWKCFQIDSYISVCQLGFTRHSLKICPGACYLNGP